MIKLFHHHHKPQKNQKETTVPEYYRITKIAVGGDPNKAYRLPFTIHIATYGDDMCLIANQIFSQLGQFYYWDQMSPDLGNVELINDDNEYVGVMAFGRFYRLPIKVKMKATIIRDVIPELAKYYHWEEVESKNDIK